MTTPIKSQRADGLGHWPAGKPRHEESDDWPLVRSLLATLLQRHPKRGVISRVVLARYLGVTENAVRKWLDGRAIPHPDLQDEVAEWLEARAEEVNAELDGRGKCKSPGDKC